MNLPVITAPLSHFLAATPPSVELLARLHPIAVHFPIALVVVAVTAEWWRVITRRDRVSRTGLTCITVGALAGAAAVITGLLNFQTQSHAQSQYADIELHRLAGFIGAGLLLGAMVLGHAAARGIGRLSGRWYVFVLTLAAIGTSITGHLGGSLVYGPDYFSEPLRALGIPLPRPTPPASTSASNATGTNPPAEQDVRKLAAPIPRRYAPEGTTLTVSYAAQVRPIFERHCFSCHGPTKRQGRLRLDIATDAFSGDPRFWPINAGKPEESELIYRITRGTDADDRMPPDGAPLSPEDVGLISQWIKEGAYEGHDPAHTAQSTPRSSAVPTPPAPATIAIAAGSQPALAALSPEQQRAIEALRTRFGARVEHVSASSNLLEVDLSLGTLPASTDPRLACEALTLAAVLSDRIERLVAAGTALDDGCGSVLGQFTHAKSINLRGTRIGDATLAAMAGCESLEMLIVYGTTITNRGVIDLAKGARSLKNLYAGSTGVRTQDLPQTRRGKIITDTAIAPVGPATGERPQR